eukprot:TRINITY_DN201_c0_g2_i1.p1 TRINITY_DN201_c0_g2~~TRINITY_DN201_c0_g2_i1.p1  ORF type:complete len:1195 (+),score=430.32 TRINITY_DN201_c0_g2_i1:67-3585(+)
MDRRSFGEWRRAVDDMLSAAEQNLRQDGPPLVAVGCGTKTAKASAPLPPRSPPPQRRAPLQPALGGSARGWHTAAPPQQGGPPPPAGELYVDTSLFWRLEGLAETVQSLQQELELERQKRGSRERDLAATLRRDIEDQAQYARAEAARAERELRDRMEKMEKHLAETRRICYDAEADAKHSARQSDGGPLEKLLKRVDELEATQQLFEKRWSDRQHLMRQAVYGEVEKSVAVEMEQVRGLAMKLAREEAHSQIAIHAEGQRQDIELRFREFAQLHQEQERAANSAAARLAELRDDAQEELRALKEQAALRSDDTDKKYQQMRDWREAAERRLHSLEQMGECDMDKLHIALMDKVAELRAESRQLIDERFTRELGAAVDAKVGALAARAVARDDLDKVQGALEASVVSLRADVQELHRSERELRAHASESRGSLRQLSELEGRVSRCEGDTAEARARADKAAARAERAEACAQTAEARVSHAEMIATAVQMRGEELGSTVERHEDDLKSLRSAINRCGVDARAAKEVASKVHVSQGTVTEEVRECRNAAERALAEAERLCGGMQTNIEALRKQLAEVNDKSDAALTQLRTGIGPPGLGAGRDEQRARAAAAAEREGLGRELRREIAELRGGIDAAAERAVRAALPEAAEAAVRTHTQRREADFKSQVVQAARDEAAGVAAEEVAGIRARYDERIRAAFKAAEDAERVAREEAEKVGMVVERMRKGGVAAQMAAAGEAALRDRVQLLEQELRALAQAQRPPPQEAPQQSPRSQLSSAGAASSAELRELSQRLGSLQGMYSSLEKELCDLRTAAATGAAAAAPAPAAGEPQAGESWREELAALRRELAARGDAMQLESLRGELHELQQRFFEWKELSRHPPPPQRQWSGRPPPVPTRGPPAVTASEAESGDDRAGTARPASSSSAGPLGWPFAASGDERDTAAGTSGCESTRAPASAAAGATSPGASSAAHSEGPDPIAQLTTFAKWTYENIQSLYERTAELRQQADAYAGRVADLEAAAAAAQRDDGHRGSSLQRLRGGGSSPAAARPSAPSGAATAPPDDDGGDGEPPSPSDTDELIDQVQRIVDEGRAEADAQLGLGLADQQSLLAGGSSDPSFLQSNSHSYSVTPTDPASLAAAEARVAALAQQAELAGACAVSPLTGADMSAMSDMHLPL